MFLESINIYIHKSYFYLGKCIAYIPEFHFSDLSKMKKKTLLKMTRDFWNIIIIPPNHLQVHNKGFG